MIYQPTKEEIEQGYYEDDSQDGFCHACREHASPVMLLDKDGEVEEIVSSCCSAKIEVN